jgi:hypothetical protein
MLQALADQGFAIASRNHAQAILAVDFPGELDALTAALLAFRIPVTELLASGGGEAASTQRLRRELAGAGWVKHNFRLETLLDGQPHGLGTSHEIDHIRVCAAGTLALEIEWNNKDPFFDRDLENFHRLHAQSIISAGIIVTRGPDLQAGLTAIIEQAVRAGGLDEAALVGLGMKDRTQRQRALVAGRVARGEDFPAAFAGPFVADKFGQATTHWAKLIERIDRGVGNPCPLLLIGLPRSCVTGYSAASPEL